MGDFDPFGAFQTTYNMASKGRKPLEGVLDAFDEEQKSNRELSLYNRKQEADLGRGLRLEKGKKKIETEADLGMLSKLGMGSGGSNGFMPESYKVGNITYKNPQYSGKLTESRNQGFLNRKRMMGAGAQSGSINAALQAKKSSDNALAILFPDGTPNSFRREIAATKNVLGRATLSKDAQNLAREYGIALDMFNKQVTGLAFSEQEYKNRVKQFTVDLLSNPEAAYESIKKLGDMSTDYLKIADPQNLFHQSTEQGHQEFERTGNQEQDYDNFVQQLIDSGVDESQALEMADQEFGL